MSICTVSVTSLFCQQSFYRTMNLVHFSMNIYLVELKFVEHNWETKRLLYCNKLLKSLMKINFMSFFDRSVIWECCECMVSYCTSQICLGYCRSSVLCRVLTWQGPYCRSGTLLSFMTLCSSHKLPLFLVMRQRDEMPVVLLVLLTKLKLPRVVRTHIKQIPFCTQKLL